MSHEELSLFFEFLKCPEKGTEKTQICLLFSHRKCDGETYFGARAATALTMAAWLSLLIEAYLRKSSRWGPLHTFSPESASVMVKTIG